MNNNLIGSISIGFEELHSISLKTDADAEADSERRLSVPFSPLVAEELHQPRQNHD
jgi:hypothetical protein